MEKQRFPHDKVCGDVITPLAQVHLEEMGVLDDIIKSNEGNWVNVVLTILYIGNFYNYVGMSRRIC